MCIYLKLKGDAVSLKILLVDNHQIVREGLRLLIDQEEHLSVVAEAGNGYDAVLLANRHIPDVVIVDITMPEMNGIDATRRMIKDNPDLKVIALSRRKGRGMVAEMFGAGAAAYLCKQCSFAELAKAIKEVCDGERFICPCLGMDVKSICSDKNESDTSLRSILSHRECEILQLLSESHTTKQVAALREISVKTVESHRQNIMKKVGIDNLVGLTKLAIREGLTTAEA